MRLSLLLILLLRLSVAAVQRWPVSPSLPSDQILFLRRLSVCVSVSAHEIFKTADPKLIYLGRNISHGER